MEGWPAVERWTLDWLSSGPHADAVVDYYPHNLYRFDRKPYLAPMAAAVSVRRRSVLLCTVYPPSPFLLTLAFTNSLD